MAVHVYCNRPSEGAVLLAKELGGMKLSRFDGMNFLRKGKRLTLAEGDFVVAWGAPLSEMDGVGVINGERKYFLKGAAAIMFLNSGVPTVRAYSSNPTGLGLDVWLPRLNNHVGGNDLLNPPTNADFWVAKEDLVEEYRIHSFAGRSIRAGVKVPREGFPNPHSWIRSFDGGWKINYDNFKSTKEMRALAHKAVKVLGLTFGAVDIGKRRDGKLIVLECNRAPGLEGNTIGAYASAIKRFVAEAIANPETEDD